MSIMPNYRYKWIVDVRGLIYMLIGVNPTKISRNVDVAELSMYVAVEVSGFHCICINIIYFFKLNV